MTVSKRVLRAAMVMALLGLGGCASTGAGIGSDPDSEFDALYDGKATTVHATQLPSSTADEADRRGDAAVRRKDADLALFHYVRALELGGAEAGILYKIGTIHASRGNATLAEQAYQMALSAPGEHAGSLEAVGLIMMQRRQHEQAEQYLHRAIDRDAKRWRAHNGLGVLADLRGQYAQAATHYAAALAIVPRSPLLLNNRGYSKYLAGDWSGAQQDFESALGIDPQHERARLNLGLVQARRDQQGEAVNTFRQVMTEAQAWNSLGYVQMVDGKYGPAETALLEAIKLSPNYYASAHENLKRVRERRHN